MSEHPSAAARQPTGPDPRTHESVVPDAAPDSNSTARAVVPPPDTTPPVPGLDQHGRVRRTRTSGIWIGLILSAIFLVLLIVFIAQNYRTAPIHFFGWRGEFPIALSLLFAAIAGMLLVAVPGTVRILQLRRTARKAANSHGASAK